MTDALCRNGLHDMTDPDNVVTDKAGRKRCRACKNDRAARSRLKKKATAEIEAVSQEVAARTEEAMRLKRRGEVGHVVPPGGIRTDRMFHRGAINRQQAALYRLAQRVRRSRP